MGGLKRVEKKIFFEFYEGLSENLTRQKLADSQEKYIYSLKHSKRFRGMSRALPCNENASKHWSQPIGRDNSTEPACSLVVLFFDFDLLSQVAKQIGRDDRILCAYHTGEIAEQDERSLAGYFPSNEFAWTFIIFFHIFLFFYRQWQLFSCGSLLGITGQYFILVDVVFVIFRIRKCCRPIGSDRKI